MFSRLMVPGRWRFLGNVSSGTELGMMSEWPLHFRTRQMLNKRSSPIEKPSASQFRSRLHPQLSDYRKFLGETCYLAEMAPFSESAGHFVQRFLIVAVLQGNFFSSHSASIPNSTVSNELDCPVTSCFATCFCPANLWGLFKMFLQVDVTVSYKNVIFIILLSTGSYVQLCRKCCSDINEYTCCHKKGNDLLL